jgi:hypothetical protein
LIDSVIAWGSEEQIRKRIEAHVAAGANHVCLMPLRCDQPNLPMSEHWKHLLHDEDWTLEDSFSPR